MTYHMNRLAPSAVLAGVVLIAAASPVLAAAREVPGLTRSAFARACEASGGVIEEGLAGAENALVCKLPNGTEITCGFAIQPPMCVWREVIPEPFRDLFGDVPDRFEQIDPPRGLTSGESGGPTTMAPGGQSGGGGAGGGGKGSHAPDPGGNPGVVDGGDNGPVVK